MAFFGLFNSKPEKKEQGRNKIDLEDGVYEGFQGYLGNFTGSNGMYAQTAPADKRSEIYNNVDFIDKYDEIVSKHLTDLSEDATQYSLQTKTPIWISSDDEKLKEELTELIERLEIDVKCTSIVRDLAKYGDKFGKLVIDPEIGVKKLITRYHPKDVVRLEHRGELNGFHLREESIPLQKYEMIHWRTSEEYVIDDILQEDFATLHERYFIDKNPSYGKSNVYKVISSSKKLKYAEDALLLGRIVKSKVYRNHYIEVGTGTIKEKIKIMREYIKNWKKNSVKDLENQDMYSEKNFFSYEEDLFHPVQEGKGSSNVDQLGGDLDIAHIEDIEYFRKKRNITLGHPGEEDYMTNRLQEDSKYAKSVSSYQKYLLKGLYELIDIHLDVIGKFSEERKYTINLVEVDSYAETTRNEMLSSSADFVEQISGLINGLVENSQVVKTDEEYLVRYLFDNFLRLPDLDYDKLYIDKPKEEIEAPVIPGQEGEEGEEGKPAPVGIPPASDEDEKADKEKREKEDENEEAAKAKEIEAEKAEKEALAKEKEKETEEKKKKGIVENSQRRSTDIRYDQENALSEKNKDE